MIKWPCTTRTNSNSSSPSSTLSELSNSPITISARKPRTPRKRPNQTYNEAAALLSMACPTIFSTKHLPKTTTNLPNFTQHHGNFFTEPPELIENSEILPRKQITEKPCFLINPNAVNSCLNVGETTSNCISKELSNGCFDDFDTKSILDEEAEQGIDIIMGDSLDSIVENDESIDVIRSDINSSHGHPKGMGFGMRNGVRAMRNGDERNSWRFSMVELVDILPVAPVKCEKSPVVKKTKKKKKKKKMDELIDSEHGNYLITGNGRRLILKLNYDAVLNAWSDKESPVPEEILQTTNPRDNIQAIAAHIDLF